MLPWYLVLITRMLWLLHAKDARRVCPFRQSAWGWWRDWVDEHTPRFAVASRGKSYWREQARNAARSRSFRFLRTDKTDDEDGEDVVMWSHSVSCDCHSELVDRRHRNTRCHHVDDVECRDTTRQAERDIVKNGVEFNTVADVWFVIYRQYYINKQLSCHR